MAAKLCIEVNTWLVGGASALMMAIYLTLLIWLWAPRVSHRSCLTSERERERKLSARSRPTNPVAHFHCGQKGCNVIFACLFAALVSLFAERACYINTNELRHQSESLHVIVLNANPPRVCVVGFENYTTLNFHTLQRQ